MTDYKDYQIDEHFFEGAEKLLEMWFSFSGSKNLKENSKCSLRLIPIEELNSMLLIAACHILHSESNTQMDSYVLRS